MTYETIADEYQIRCAADAMASVPYNDLLVWKEGVLYRDQRNAAATATQSRKTLLRIGDLWLVR